MSRTLLSVSVVAFLASVGLAQTTQPAPKPQPSAQPGPIPAQPAGPVATKPVPTGPAPKIVFDKTEFDWGTTLDTDPVDMEFTFTNTGDADLTITDLHASCGCTVPTLKDRAIDATTGEPIPGAPNKGMGTIETTYKPGEKGSIKVRFNPHGKRNDQSQRVTIKCNDPAAPESTLFVKGKVIPLVVYDPPVLQFGDVNKGDTVTMIVSVTGRTPDFEVTYATVTEQDYFDVKILETRESESEGEKLRSTELEVTLKEGAPVGVINPTLTIRTNDARKPFDNQSISVRIMGDLKASPQTLAMGTLNAGEAFEKKFRVASRSGAKFTIQGAEQKSTFPGKIEVKTVPVDASGTQYDIVVTGMAPDRQMAVRGNLIVRTNVLGEERLEVPFHGSVRPKPVPPAAKPATPTPAQPK